jgi:hypothetical protein
MMVVELKMRMEMQMKMKIEVEVQALEGVRRRWAVVLVGIVLVVLIWPVVRVVARLVGVECWLARAVELAWGLVVFGRMRGSFGGLVLILRRMDWMGRSVALMRFLGAEYLRSM